MVPYRLSCSDRTDGRWARFSCRYSICILVKFMSFQYIFACPVVKSPPELGNLETEGKAEEHIAQLASPNEPKILVGV
ncbi:hypothetical protein YSY43_11030 [Paenibacillus sp. YSY-4.3]